jgi:hypothetical protein
MLPVFAVNMDQIDQAKAKWQACYNMEQLEKQKNEQAIQRAVDWITTIWTPVLQHNRECLAEVQDEYNKSTLTCYRLEYALFDEDGEGNTHIDTEQVYVLNHEPTAEGFYYLAGGLVSRMVKYSHVVLLELENFSCLNKFPGSLKSTHWIDEAVGFVITPNTVSEISVFAALASSGIEALPEPSEQLHGISRDQWAAAIQRTYPRDEDHRAYSALWGHIRTAMSDDE